MRMDRLCEIYGQSSIEMGPIIAFNLRRWDGSWFGYHEVQKLASLLGIQLRVPEMSKVSTIIDIRQHKLLLESPNCLDKLEIPLQPASSYELVYEELDLHGERYEVHGYSLDINSWLSKAIGRSCVLVRCLRNQHSMKRGRRGTCRDEKMVPDEDKNRRNQYMLIHQGSIQMLLFQESNHMQKIIGKLYKLARPILLGRFCLEFCQGTRRRTILWILKNNGLKLGKKYMSHHHLPPNKPK